MNHHLAVAGVALAMFAAVVYVVPSLLADVKMRVLVDLRNSLSGNRRTLLLNSVVVAVVAGLASLAAQRLCGTRGCLTNLRGLSSAPTPLRQTVSL